MSQVEPGKGPSAPDGPASAQPQTPPADDAGIDPRVLLIVGVIVLILIVVYWRQSTSRETGPDNAAAPASAPAEAGQGGQPQRPPTYAEMRFLRRQQATQFIYGLGDRQLVVAAPPRPPQQTEKGVTKAMPGVFFDVTKRAEHVRTVDLFRRQFGNQMAFRDVYVPVGVANDITGKAVQPVLKKAAEAAKAAEGGTADIADPDPVVGVSIGKESRAYPRKFVKFHDVINDTVGGTPVAIVYSGAAGAVLAYARKVGDAEMAFGCSGLVYQAANVMYDKATEALWSGLTGECLTKDMTGKRLERVAVYETTWSFWKAQHPETDVMTGVEPALPVPYQTDYTVGGDGYHQDPEFVLYPVEQYEPGQTAGPKTVVFGVETDDGAKAYELAYVEKLTQKVADAVGKTRLTLEYDAAAGSARATTADGKPLVCQRMYWFAWKGNHPKSDYQGSQAIPPVFGAGAGDPDQPAGVGAGAMGQAQMGTPNVEPLVDPKAAKPKPQTGAPQAPAAKP